MKERVRWRRPSPRIRGHRQLGVVVQDALGHAAQKGKGRDVTVQKGLGGLCRIGLHEATVAVGQVQHQVVHLALHSGDHRHCLPEVALAWPGGWDKGTNISCVRRRFSLT